MSEPAKRGGWTRRRLLLAGGIGATALVGGAYGRYAVGDEFEEHVASALGLRPEAVTRLLSNARSGLGDANYDVRAAAFVAATTWPGSSVMPESARRDAIDALVIPMITSSEDNLLALGLRDRYLGSCAGLLRR